MRKHKLSPAGGLVLVLVAAGALLNVAFARISIYDGETTALGHGTANTYLILKHDDTPVAVGVRLSEAALEGLPGHPNNTSRCFDLNGDGALEAGAECLGDYEMVMSWPAEIERANLPFEWMGLNWNPHGHVPKQVYDLPHFDVHFYMAERELVSSIRPGSCGEWVDCEDFKRASIPVPAQFLPPGHVDVGAVVTQMGNHLVNPWSAELATPPQRFTHTLIYGAYDGQLIFIEPMVTREFLLGKPDMCAPIAQPAAWQKPANYPTKYCIRHLPDQAAVTISLEGFVKHRMAQETDETGGYPELS